MHFDNGPEGDGWFLIALVVVVAAAWVLVSIFTGRFN